MTTHRFATASASLMLAFALSGSAYAQTAGQDMHNAGTDTKAAAGNTGHAVKHTTKKAYHKTAHGTHTAAHDTKSGTAKAADKTKEGTVIAADKTKEGTVTGFNKTKEGTEKVLHVGNHNASVAKDNASQANMKAHDDATIDKAKAQANSPH